MTRHQQRWDSLDYVVIDVEGNGARPPELVELAVVPITGGIISDPRAWLVRPPSPITWQARRIHGISSTDVADHPAFADIADEVLAALGNATPVGHNVRVDLDVLARTLPRWHPPEAIDTLRLSRATWNLPSHRLGALVEHRNLAADLPADLPPHRARYDALVTARLLIELATNTTPEPLTVATLRENAGITLTPAAEAQPTLFD